MRCARIWFWKFLLGRGDPTSLPSSDHSAVRRRTRGSWSPTAPLLGILELLGFACFVFGLPLPPGSTCYPRLIPEEVWYRDGATVGAFDGDSRGRRNAYSFGNLRVQGPVHLAPVLWPFFWRVTSSAVSAARALLGSQCCRERGGRRSGNCLVHHFGGVSDVRVCIDVAGPAFGRPGPRDESGLSKAQLALSWCVAPSFPPLVAKLPFLADQDDCHPPRFSAEGS